MDTAPKLKIHRSVTKALKLFDADRFRWLDEAASLGPVAGMQMGPVTTWVVTDPNAARTMLVTDSASWMRPPATVAPIRVGVGENLFTASDKKWALIQPSVAPAFRKKALDARLAEVDPIVDDELRAIPCDTTVDLELAMARIALRLAAWVLLGEELEAAHAEELAHHQREVVRWIGVQLGRLSGFLPVALGARGREMKRHRAVLNAYADEVIARANRGSRAEDDVLGALLAARPSGRPLAPDDLRYHVLGLFLAGNETTAAALTWALVQGARNPAEWAKVGADPGARSASFITETLRLTPAVWAVPRTPKQPGVTLTSAGMTTRVRRGQLATVYLRGINRDENIWPDPLRFDPSRHDADAGGDTDAKEQHRTLLPFGLGPRGCIGQHLALAELSAVLPALARRGAIMLDSPAVEDPSFALRVRGGLKGRFASA